MIENKMRDLQGSQPVLVYDGECPVCSAYVRFVRIRKSAGELLLVNARDGGPWLERVTQAGLNLDEGMVLFYGGRAYHAQDSIHTLALLSTGLGTFNRLNAAIFRNPTAARVLYPVLRAGRNLLLRILNKPKLSLK